MLKKTVSAFTLLLSGAVLLSFTTDRNFDEDYSEQQRLLVKITGLIEKNHYAPQTIDDTFSKLLWSTYLDKLDPRKELFLQSDLAQLKKYETTLDDELHGTTPVAFVPSALKVYVERLKDDQEEYNKILSVPFKFNTNEEINADGSIASSFPASASAQKDIRAKRLKYLTLENFLELKRLQTLNRATDSLAGKSDAELEVMARLKTQKRTDREFKNLLGNVGITKQFPVFVNVFVRLMDPHTDYFPPAEAQNFGETLSLRVAGIGVHMKEDEQGVKVADIAPGTPAWKSGQVQENDLFLKVGEGLNGPMTDITGMPSTELVKLIRGSKGSVVRITFKKTDGNLKTVTLTRDDISQDDAGVRAAVIYQGSKKLGYITFPLFYSDPNADGKHCAVDVGRALIALKAEHVDGIVVDLRRNGGGSLKEVVDMVGLFVGAGPAVQVRERNKNPVKLENQALKQLYDGPLAVMVDELSASASEIFTGAMQDYHRAVIIGSTSSYGKGTVQKPLAIEKKEDGILKLTVEQFYRVNGESTQMKGITPDIIFPDVLEYQKIREKDNPNALSWDMVAPANYTPLTNNMNLEALEKSANDRITKDPVFKSLKVSLLAAHDIQIKKISLNYIKYKAQQDQRKKIGAETAKLLMLPIGKEMDTRPVVLYDKGNYKEWLKKLSGDIYLDQTVKTLSEIAKL